MYILARPFVPFERSYNDSKKEEEENGISLSVSDNFCNISVHSPVLLCKTPYP